MKIQRANLEYIDFTSVPIGGVFTFNNQKYYYMRIASYEDYNAIDLETTKLKAIDANTSVILINGAFIEK